MAEYLRRHALSQDVKEFHVSSQADAFEQVREVKLAVRHDDLLKQLLHLLKITISQRLQQTCHGPLPRCLVFLLDEEGHG